MPSVTAFAKCPGLIFVRPRFDVYREISAAIHAIFKRYSGLVEGVALDEAYLDVTENKQNITYTSTIARHIKTAIFQETQLTATAGVSINKFLAKMASGQNTDIPEYRNLSANQRHFARKWYGRGLLFRDGSQFDLALIQLDRYTPQSPIQVIVAQNDHFFFSVYKGENEKLIVS